MDSRGRAARHRERVPPDQRGRRGRRRRASRFGQHAGNPGVVSLDLAASTFAGSGDTAVMRPVVTFGPDAVGVYDVRFEVDNEAGAIQADDVLGLFRVLPAGCVKPVQDLTITGPTHAPAGATVTLTASLLPVTTSSPVAYVWAPQPLAGQGTPSGDVRLVGWRRAARERDRDQLRRIRGREHAGRRAGVEPAGGRRHRLVLRHGRPRGQPARRGRALRAHVPDSVGRAGDPRPHHPCQVATHHSRQRRHGRSPARAPCRRS